MCDYIDEMWDSKARWQKYVDARVLEITCGEAPFLVSRYDVETGEVIPVPDRIGLLDRKLRTVNENAQTEENWLSPCCRVRLDCCSISFRARVLMTEALGPVISSGVISSFRP